VTRFGASAEWGGGRRRLEQGTEDAPSPTGAHEARGCGGRDRPTGGWHDDGRRPRVVRNARDRGGTPLARRGAAAARQRHDARRVGWGGVSPLRPADRPRTQRLISSPLAHQGAQGEPRRRKPGGPAAAGTLVVVGNVQPDQRRRRPARRVAAAPQLRAPSSPAAHADRRLELGAPSRA